MKIHFLGTHNAESKKTKHISLLIDEQIVIDAGCLTSELDFKQQEKILSILLTHGHYDHIKEIPSFAFNNYTRTTNIYASTQTHQILSTHLIDGVIYPKFNEKTSFTKNIPLHQVTIKPYQRFSIDDYTIVPIPVNHIDGSFGFEVTSKDGAKIFFTGDTGPGLENVWEHTSPDTLIIDLTFPNRLKNFAIDAKHLCPDLLKKELHLFKKMKGYLPKIILIHLSPKYKPDIRNEIRQISKELQHGLEIAIEDDSIIV